MLLTTTLGRQGGRRYPQLGALPAVSLQQFAGVGSPPTPGVVVSDNAGATLGAEGFGGNAPGTITLGDGGRMN